jgi:L-alanine-DL-glutamate epimerase-like enolase superfamily enzyme
MVAMDGQILESEVWMVGVDLPHPFKLAFGTLNTLPRVFLILTIEGLQQKSIGEASIDFPFSKYDAWDVYNALASTELGGINANDREVVLKSEKYRELLEFPAAFAALNMALDDAFGRLHHRSIPQLYGVARKEGKPLESIPFLEGVQFINALNSVMSRRRIPKIKGGRGINEDVAQLRIVGDLGIPFAVDFNNVYSVEKFEELVKEIGRTPGALNGALFFEQPTHAESGIQGLSEAKRILHSIETINPVPIMADESFTTLEDALECSKYGIILNYKIQKIGGIAIALEIENQINSVSTSSSMIGGTFPTALGRVWDQQALCVLQTTTLPSDGWQPSTDWFTQDKHFIDEQFSEANGQAQAFLGEGLGVTVRWDLLEKHKISNPASEYQAIRHNLSGKHLSIQLNSDKSYSSLYQRLSGRSPDWNL